MMEWYEYNDYCTHKLLEIVMCGESLDKIIKKIYLNALTTDG